MALILNIETSSENCSVAIAEGGIVTAALQSSDSKSHAIVLTVLIERLLRENDFSFSDLDAISVSKGPGSYTGLRIGVSVAKGICYGAGKPLIAINTLESMMNGLRLETPDFENSFHNDDVFCPMIDARRQEVYLAEFSKNGTCLKDTSAEIIQDDSFNDILARHTMVFFGSGAEKLKTIIKGGNAVFIDNFSAQAQYLASLSEKAFQKNRFEDVAYFEPLYLKDFVATIPKRKVL